MKPGDRVLIVGRDHPWYAHAGVIEEPFNRAGLEWAVKLDGTYEPTVACAEEELRAVEAIR